METNEYSLQQSAISEQDGVRQVRLKSSARAGANWFLWIAALSVINTVIAAAQGNLHFVCGLGITSLVDQLAARLGSDAAGFAVSGFIAGVVALLGVFGRKGIKWAF